MLTKMRYKMTKLPPIHKKSPLHEAHYTAQHRPRPASPISATKLIKSLCAQGLLLNARQLFDEMPHRDIVAWTAMISGYSSAGDHRRAWDVFFSMMDAGFVPNAFTLSSVLKACKGMDWCFGGAMVHGLVVKMGLELQEYLENALVDVYATCGRGVEDARKVFDGMTEKTVVSWTTMIAGYTHQGDACAGIRLFQRMIQEGVELNPYTCSIVIRACSSVGSVTLGKQMHANAVKSAHDHILPVANALLDLYSRCKSLSEAKQYFNEMPHKDSITWNCMIAGLEQCIPHEALQLLIRLKSHDIIPNCFTYTSIASACASLAALSCGQQVHAAVIRKGFNGNLQMNNSLVDMYAKCGSIADSQRIFIEMPERDLISWTCMMNGFGIHGHGKESTELFDTMIALGIAPDSIVFLGVISACSHSGLVEEGLKYFHLMKNRYNVVPDKEVYGCVVDLLGRAGRLKEAHELIEMMPFEPDESTWGALLGACKTHKNMELGRLAAEKILDLKPYGAKTYVILSDLHAACSEWSEFAEARRIMRGMGGKKETGMSCVEVKNEAVIFVSGDRVNPKAELVYGVLLVLALHMNHSGVLFHFDCDVEAVF